MKIRPIDKSKLIQNTPTNLIIKSLTLGAAGFTFAFGYYLIVNADKYIHPVLKYFNAYSQEIDIKIADQRNKSFEQNAYRIYLEEKKTYQKQLEAETEQRLEKLKAKLNQQNQTQTVPKQQQQEQTAKDQATNTNRKSIYYYLKLEFLRNK